MGRSKNSLFKAFNKVLPGTEAHRRGGGKEIPYREKEATEEVTVTAGRIATRKGETYAIYEDIFGRKLKGKT